MATEASRKVEDGFINKIAAEANRKIEINPTIPASSRAPCRKVFIMTAKAQNIEKKVL
jgi:hypothetical protein